MSTESITVSNHNSVTESNNKHLKKITYPMVFSVLCSMFFLWGLPNVLNGIIMPKLQLGFHLTNLQTGIIDSSFYFGYFFAPIIAAFIANKFGFKITIIFGLLALTFGSFICAISSDWYVFLPFLIGLFVMAGGCGFLESSANPIATLLGPKDFASFRLNFAQIFNALATVLTALIGGILILNPSSFLSKDQLAQLSDEATHSYFYHLVSSLTTPYLIIAVILLIATICIIFVKFPKESELGDAGQSSDGYIKTFKRVIQISHFRWALFAMFLMNGCQNGLWGWMIRFSSMKLNISMSSASYFYTYVILGALFGRVFGSYLLHKYKAHTVLGTLSSIAGLLAIFSVFLPGMMAIYSLFLASFFAATLYPTIFSLGIAGLGRDTKIGSTFMVMMIVGSSFMVPIMGFIADHVTNFSAIELIPALGWLIIGYYGFKKAVE